MHRLGLSCLSILLLMGASSVLAQEDDGAQVDVGPGSGLTITSSDGNNQVQLRGALQLWATLQELDSAAEDAVQVSPRIRRARLILAGHYYRPENRFFLQVGFSPQDLEAQDERVQVAPLVDAYLEFAQLRDLTVRVGQQLVTMHRTWETRSTALELPERSLSERRFELGRRLGVQFRSDDLFGLRRLSYRAGVYFAPAESREAPISVDASARVQVRLLGEPQLGIQGDLSRSPSPRLAVGTGYAFLMDEPAGAGNRDQHQLTGDLVFRIAGVSLDGAIMWRRDREDDGFGERPELGGNAQLSYLLPWFDLAAVVRYSAVKDVDGDFLTQEWTGGLGYYFFAAHPFKVQLSVSHTDVAGDGRWSGIAALQAEL